MRPHSANKANPLFDPPRGAVLCGRLDLDMDPESRAERRAIEVFPHPATVVLFRLPKILKYKEGEVEDRRRELLQLDDTDRGARQGDPRLRVNHNMAWVDCGDGWRPRPARYNSTGTRIPSTPWFARTSRSTGITGRRT